MHAWFYFLKINAYLQTTFTGKTPGDNHPSVNINMAVRQVLTISHISFFMFNRMSHKKAVGCKRLVMRRCFHALSEKVFGYRTGAWVCYNKFVKT